MHPDKAPGPNGMNLGFFQNYRDIIVTTDKETLACLDFLNNGHFPPSLNTINLILIPKKQEKPLKITDLRPIALCNVIYKIMAKALAFRLKNVLPVVISETQSAFL